MNNSLEVPPLVDLDGLVVDVSPDSPWVVSVSTSAGDGDAVMLSWDEIAGSVSFRWLEGAIERLVLEREAASKVSVRREHGHVQFWVWFRADGLSGQLIVDVGERVTVSDAILRT